jgi:hypothetical protein
MPDPQPSAGVIRGEELRHQFLPAIIPGISQMQRKHKPKYPLHWMDPAFPEVYRPVALGSYHYWKTEDFELMNPEMTFFGDSGGFSLVTVGASLCPEAVIRWQVDQCTRGAILDVPPYRMAANKVLMGSAADHWEDSLNRTLSNVRRALPIYLEARKAGTPFRWWGVIQGETWDQLNEWHGRVSEIYPFTDEGEGWAFKPHPTNNVVVLARLFRFVREHGIKRAHFLQTTGARAAGVLLGLAQLTRSLELTTYDSASASQYGANRHCWVLGDEGMKVVGHRPRPFNAEYFLSAKCDCPACRWFAEERETELGDVLLPDRLIQHNHEMLFRLFDNIWSAAQADPERVVAKFSRDDHGKVMRELEGVAVQKTAARTQSIFDLLGG